MLNRISLNSRFLPMARLFALTALASFVVGCSGGGKSDQESSPAMSAPQEQGMTAQELAAMPKIDAHTHIYGLQDEEAPAFLDCMKSYNFKWMTICTQGMKWEHMKASIALAAKMHSQHPDVVSWATSFNMSNWGDKDWEKKAIANIQDGFDKGAVAVKVWKEIGMVLKDPDGKYVMIDDPRFDPILSYIAGKGKTLVAHIGEPRNCWLPLDSMTVNNDRLYFAEHPEYHSFLHPEIPGYWKQIASRDSLLAHHPELRVVGCHLGSLEFDVDEMARRFDLYPNFAVDMAARVCHFQVQDREKVRNFMIKYQDRILYGTDLGAGRVYMQTSIDSTITKIRTTYDNDFKYFATDEEMEVWEVNGKFRGLALPAEVLRKIFHDNAEKWYPGI